MSQGGESKGNWFSSVLSEVAGGLGDKDLDRYRDPRQVLDFEHKLEDDSKLWDRLLGEIVPEIDPIPPQQTEDDYECVQLKLWIARAFGAKLEWSDGRQLYTIAPALDEKGEAPGEFEWMSMDEYRQDINALLGPCKEKVKTALEKLSGGED